MKVNCASLCRMNKKHSCLIRICFYGLFLAGPYFISEAHEIYFHRNIAVSECASAEEKDKILEQYYAKAKAMMWVGIGCSFAWLIWLIAAVIIKLCPTKELKHMQDTTSASVHDVVKPRIQQKED